MLLYLNYTGDDINMHIEKKLIFFIAYIFFVICFFVPETAYAYLDPGTGNALIYVVLSLLGSAFFFLKGVYYRLKEKKDENREKIESIKANSVASSIVIFSEGKAYWNTYKPIVEKLIEKGQSFVYYTMDIKDPCLQIDNPLMNNRYIGNGNVAFAKIGNLTAGVVLTTTPNIGTKGYPIPRSKRIQNLVYVDHGMLGDFSYLCRGALDHYDTVLLIGAYQIPLMRKLEKMRNLPEKTLVPAGIPYVEELLKRAGENTAIFNKDVLPEKPQDITVLLAPSHGAKSFLSKYGVDFIVELANKNFNLIFRPHPQSFKTDKELMQRVKTRLKNVKNLVWDLNPDATLSFQKADILISDSSGIRRDFAFVYFKPFITLPIPIEALEEFEMVDLEGSWSEEEMKKAGIGYTLAEEEIRNLDTVILRILKDNHVKAILEFRNKHIFNWGNASDAVADYLIQAAKNIK